MAQRSILSVANHALSLFLPRLAVGAAMTRQAISRPKVSARIVLIRPVAHRPRRRHRRRGHMQILRGL